MMKSWLSITWSILLAVGLTLPGPTLSASATVTAAPLQTPPAITVAPRSVIPGASAQVIGTGFASGSQVTVRVAITLRNGSTDILQTRATVGQGGDFVARLQIPGDIRGGKYRVDATGAGRRASGTLVIAILKPSVVVVPAQAIPGTPIIVNGFGFSSTASITVSLAGQTLGTAQARRNGDFKSTFTVPSTLATGMYTLTAQESSGRRASIPVRVYRTIATRAYFASIDTSPGFHEFLQFVNTTAVRAKVHIAYQFPSHTPRRVTITIPAHARLAHDVNTDLGQGVRAAVVVAADVPISAERMVLHGRDGAIDPGTPSPSRIWYFANGNTSHGYREDVTVQNPTTGTAEVSLQVQPTHSKTFYLRRSLRPQSRTQWNLNTVSNDAIGVIVRSSAPVVANRTIYIHNGMSSKTGVKGPQTHWYFAAGPNLRETRNWIGVINTTTQPSSMTLHAYNALGAEVATVTRTLKPLDRQGYLMNTSAGQPNVAVEVTTTKPAISEQSTFVTSVHDAHTESFGVTTPQTTAEFAEATTWSGQNNFLALFNPNQSPIPIVVQFLSTQGNTTEQSYVIAPLAHEYVNVGRVVPNAQLGLLAASNYPFVALDRQTINNGKGAMTTLGSQS